MKFNDLDGDGIKDAGEPGLEAWTILVDTNGNGQFDVGELSTQTASNGTYSFQDLGVGTYSVLEIQQQGWKQTRPVGSGHEVTVSEQEDVVDVDFGNAQVGTISGVKYDDANGNGVRDAGEPGLEGWTIFIDANGNGTLDAGEKSVQTGADGGYVLEGLVAGTHTVAEVQQQGWVPTAPSGGAQAVQLAAGEAQPGVDFGNTALAGIAGTKFEDLDGDGVKDAGEPGLGGWTIFIDANGSGTLDAGEESAQTGDDGGYTFLGLQGGTYVVAEVLQAGWSQTLPAGGTNTIDLADGEQRTGVDFGNTRPGTLDGVKFEDRDRNGVQDNGEPGLQGWTIFLDLNGDGQFNDGEPSTLTGPGGSYQFAGLTPGLYRVAEVLPPFTWEQTAPEYAAALGGDGAASGSAHFALDLAGQLRATMSFDRLSSAITELGIYRGDPDSGGILIFDLTTSEGLSQTGYSDPAAALVLNDALRTSLDQGDMYVRVVTANNPTGEIKGPISTSNAHLVPVRSGLHATSLNFGNVETGTLPNVPGVTTWGLVIMAAALLAAFAWRRRSVTRT